MVGRQRAARLVATAFAAAALSLVLVSVHQEEDLGADVLLQGGLSRNGASLQMLDQVTKMVGYAPTGISYGEGQMPLGLGAASGICDHGYCPQEGEGVEINPREVPSSKFAVRWDGFNWETMDDDVNIFQPSDCLAKHLAGDEDACCEHDTEPCDKWGDGRHPHPEMAPYPIPPPVPKVRAKPRPPRGEEVKAPGWSPHPYTVPYARQTAVPPSPLTEAEPAPEEQDVNEPEAEPEPEEQDVNDPEAEPAPGEQDVKDGDIDWSEFSKESYPGEWEVGGEQGSGEGGKEEHGFGEGGKGEAGGASYIHGYSEGGEGGDKMVKGGKGGGGEGGSYSYTYTSGGGEMPEGYKGGKTTYSYTSGEGEMPEGGWEWEDGKGGGRRGTLRMVGRGRKGRARVWRGRQGRGRGGVLHPWLFGGWWGRRQEGEGWQGWGR